MMPLEPAMGFFGKLPARGDFLRVGLPRSFTDPLDDWLRSALAASRAAFGDRWGAVWEAAPIWRFALPPGACGPSPAIGVMLPSRDSVGRSFPLVLARLTPAADPAAADFLSSAESAGRHAIRAMLSPEAVLPMLGARPEAPPLPDMPDRTQALWWTEPGDRRLVVPAFPAPGDFAAMLT